MKFTPQMDANSHVAAFLNGSSDHAYSFLGAHPVQQDEKSGWLFRVWAPRAKAVSVIGSFSGWSEQEHPMHRLDGGIWECFLAGPKQGDSYQYVIQTQDGQSLNKADPVGFWSEVRPRTASRLFDLSGYHWDDGPWLEFRSRRSLGVRPMNVYELHLGSWRRTGDGRYLSYREIAQWLVPYVKEMGFTAVEFMPVMEHLQDESFGYHTTGYFAPTSRFGSPHDFMYLVDQLHQGGVAVILDWVPSHFALGEGGLFDFDGASCYTCPQRGAHASLWGPTAFDYGRGEVRSFLLSSALYWVREYHIDGLRIDSLSSMLYWATEEDGKWVYGQENRDAVAFLRQLTGAVHAHFPSVCLIAEEEKGWPHVTAAPDQNPQALGFDLKWNAGWVHNTMSYMSMDPVYRQYNQRHLTFPMMYAYSEAFLLPVSHEEFAAGKESLVSRMPGDDTLKFAGVRVFYLYLLSHPGKKLLMMGCEFGQINPWRHEYSLDWHLLDYLPFRRHQAFCKAANQFYLANPPLWEIEYGWEGFQWVCEEDAGSNVLLFRRIDRSGQELLVAFNFSPVDRLGYRIGVPTAGEYQAVFDTDRTDFGGGGRVNTYPIRSYPITCHRFPNSIVTDLPPMTGVVFRCTKLAPARARSNGNARSIGRSGQDR